jgi:hypothetical protein
MQHLRSVKRDVLIDWAAGDCRRIEPFRRSRDTTGQQGQLPFEEFPPSVKRVTYKRVVGSRGARVNSTPSERNAPESCS